MATAGSSSIFGLSTFCVVTGASKGYGQALALRLAAKLPDKSVMFLMARNRDGLNKTNKEILKKFPQIRVAVLPIDLSSKDKGDLEKHFSTVFSDLEIEPSDFEQGFIVHNAASLGDVSKLYAEQDNFDELQKYWDLNLTAVTLLNHVFLKFFSQDSVKQRVIINMSSICALQPFKSWSLYCAGKAARDMLFRTMALEDPTVRILNFAPGPIDTEMQQEARRNTADEEIRNIFIDMKENSKLLSCDQSIDKLIPLLEKNTFDSGAHIDYYDI